MLKSQQTTIEIKTYLFGQNSYDSKWEVTHDSIK